MNRFIAIVHRWHVHSNGFIVEEIEAGSEEEAKNKAGALAHRLNTPFNSSAVHLLHIGDQVVIEPRRLTMWERLTGRIEQHHSKSPNPIDERRETVKPLIWSPRNDQPQYEVCADTPFGRYKISNRGEYGYGWQQPRQMVWSGFLPTVHEAKAAQTDWEARIRSTLSTEEFSNV